MATPVKYRAEFCQGVISHMEKGKSITSFAAQCNVSKKTLYEWLQQYPEFKEAKAIGEAKSVAWWEDLGQGAVTGQVPGFQQAAYIFTMKCRFGKFGYRDDVQVDDDGDETTLQNVPTATLLRIAKGK